MATGWTDWESDRKRLQKQNTGFSRAELCRRASIAETTFFKGLKNRSRPQYDVRKAIELVLEAERAFQAAGVPTIIRGETI